MATIWKRWFLGTWTTPYSHGIMHHAIIRCANGDIARIAFEKRTKQQVFIKPILRGAVCQYKADRDCYPIIDEQGNAK